MSTLPVAAYRGWFWRFCVTFKHADGRPNDLPAIPFWRLKRASEEARRLVKEPNMRGCIVEVYQRHGMGGGIRAEPIERYYGRGAR